MAKIEGFQYQLAANKKWISPCMMRRTRKQQASRNNWVWVPAIPSWEKQFCSKIGLFKWEDFLESKKNTTGFTNEKIMEWNDSAAKDAFFTAKRRFLAKINGEDFPGITDPDLYIDEIDWDDNGPNSGFLDGPEFGRSISDDEEEEVRNYVENGRDNDKYLVPDCYYIRIEDINPTGWDVDVEEISRGRVLTGLVVGGGDYY